jgi:hypothetical protein
VAKLEAFFGKGVKGNIAELADKNHCPKQIENAADYSRCEKEPRGQHGKAGRSNFKHWRNRNSTT